MGLFGPKSRPAKDLEAASDITKDALEEVAADTETGGRTLTGINSDYLPENIPVWDLTSVEKVIGGRKSNAFIVLGKDRLCSQASGYGGAGYTGAGSIALIAGLNNELKGNPSAMIDAATIYLSQLTDVDRAVDLVPGVVGSKKKRSGIFMRADGIRLSAREGIKITTGGRGDTNSFSNKVETTTGVDIIAGNSDEQLEPMVKGTALMKALDDIIERINALAGMVDSLAKNQTQIDAALAAHMHIVSPIPPLALPDPILAGISSSTAIRNVVQCIAPGYLNNINNTILKIDKLEPFGAAYICSRHNNVN